MLQLSPDETFHYELLRVLGSARDLGSDIGEVLAVASRIVPGDFESWSTEFDALGQRVRAQAQEEAALGRTISARNAFFRAASYFRSADFFLHGNPSDPRINSLWDAATTCFDEAIARLDIPGQRIRIRADGFEVPAIFFRAPGEPRPRPTLLLCNGFDGSQEEMFHASGLAALARGFNVVTFEGPGHPTVRRDQGLPFIAEWEKVVTPVIDWCETQPDIDAARIGLMGYSMGGWLVARAATREHRLAAVACVDGLFDLYTAFAGGIPAPFKAMLQDGNIAGLNAAMTKAKADHTRLRWAIEHGCWAFDSATPFDFLMKTKGMSLAGIADKIACPVLVCDADDDQFFKGQPPMLAKALGSRATYHVFTQEDAASTHCHVGASDFMNAIVMGWFGDALQA